MIDAEREWNWLIMTDVDALPESLCRRILNHLGLPAGAPPSLNALQSLIAGYTRTVPWESASRIRRRANHAESADCALLGEAFWESSFEHGTGGTCYESNYAFFGLLRRLGYEGYLTINDMGESIGCHSAIVVALDAEKFLVDVGLPLHAALPLRDDGVTTAKSAIMEYTVEPLGERRYAIWRELQPRRSAFQLNDRAVSDADYRAIAIHDYRHDGGQFLNEIVIHKVVNETLWRFNSDEIPFCLQEFVDGERIEHALGVAPAAELAAKFDIAREVLTGALGIICQPPSQTPPA